MAITVWQNGISTGSAPSITKAKPIHASGDTFWVDSTSTASADGSQERPYTTLLSAVTSATSSNGDTIILKATHRETISSTITQSKNGLTIVGEGSGSARPQITSNVAGVLITLSGTRCRVENIMFLASTAATTSRLNITGAGNMVKDCAFTSDTNDTADTVLVAANDVTVMGCTFTAVGTATTRAGRAIKVTSGSGGWIYNNTFDGGTQGWTTYALSMSSALTDWRWEANTFLGVDCNIGLTTTGAKGVIYGITQTSGQGLVRWTA